MTVLAAPIKWLQPSWLRSPSAAVVSLVSRCCKSLRRLSGWRGTRLDRGDSRPRPHTLRHRFSLQHDDPVRVMSCGSKPGCVANVWTAEVTAGRWPRGGLSFFDHLLLLFRNVTRLWVYSTSIVPSSPLYSVPSLPFPSQPARVRSVFQGYSLSFNPNTPHSSHVRCRILIPSLEPSDVASSYQHLQVPTQHLTAEQSPGWPSLANSKTQQIPLFHQPSWHWQKSSADRSPATRSASQYCSPWRGYRNVFARNCHSSDIGAAKRKR